MQLSIYDSPASPILLVPEPPSALQLQISSVRKAAQSVYGDLSSKARQASNQWIGAEHKLERELIQCQLPFVRAKETDSCAWAWADELSSLRAKDEPLTPGAF